MEITFKPFCAQISSLKFISDACDSQNLFLIGTHLENTNTLTLMGHNSSNANVDEPSVLCRIKHQSDVMDIQYNANHRRALTSGADGSLSIYRIDEADGDNGLRLGLDIGWSGVCVSAISGAVLGDERIVAVGEGGEIIGVYLDADAANMARGFEFVARDCAGVTAVEAVERHSFVTANALGQVKCWDVRTPMRVPVWTSHRSGAETSPTTQCLATHPGQPHIVASGNNSSVFLHDLRQSQPEPLQLHTGLRDSSTLIHRLRFHPTHPARLFIAASASGLLELAPASATVSSLDWTSASDVATLSLDTVVGSRTVSMTTLDVAESLVIAGTDKEMLCLVPI